MSIFEKALELEKKGMPFAMATILSSEGSSPGHAGSKMIVYGECEAYGSIGGGAVEDAVKKQCIACIKKGRSEIFHYKLNESAGIGLNMRCGGNIDVFIEVFKQDIRLVIFGGGHIALALAKMADILGYPYTIIDNRPEFASGERFPNSKEVVYSKDFEEPLEGLYIDSSTFIIIATHGHLYDEKVLHSVIGSGAAYIGMIGSKRKVSMTFESLKNKGVPEEKLFEVFSPIGLDLGAETPGEIAVSIMAEVLKYKNKSSGRSFKEAMTWKE